MGPRPVGPRIQFVWIAVGVLEMPFVRYRKVPVDGRHINDPGAAVGDDTCVRFPGQE